MDQAVAITGMGMITAQGVGVRETWRGVVEGTDALRIWSQTPQDHPLSKLKVAQCVSSNELPRPADLPQRLWGRLSRTQQLACVAADEAIEHACLPRDFASRPGATAGLFLATTVCGMDVNERYYEQYLLNRDTANIEFLRRVLPYEVAALLGRRYEIREGLLRSVCLSTCVGSAMALGSAMDAINLGECDLAIAGGSEALCRVVLSGFHSLKVVAPEGCRPFDKDRPGITVGEGSGILVLESVEHAQRRGAKILGYLRGFGVTCDAHHLTAPDPQGRQAARAVREALQRAAIEPSRVDYVNAHGTGTRDNDNMESKVIREVFSGAPEMPAVSSTKRCTGHTFGAAGAIEAIFCLQSILEGVVPPNAGSLEADPALNIPVVRGAAMKKDVRVAMSTNFAFGGNNTALVLAREAADD